MGRQLTQLAGDLPQYEFDIREKVKSLRGASAWQRTSSVPPNRSRILGGNWKSLALGLAAEFTCRWPDSEAYPGHCQYPQPRRSRESGKFLLRRFCIPRYDRSSLLFLIFILVQREDLRNRLIRLGGTRDIQRTTAALDDAASRLSRLFLMQLVINAGFGLVIGLGLLAIRDSQRFALGIFARRSGSCLTSVPSSPRLFRLHLLLLSIRGGRCFCGRDFSS